MTDYFLERRAMSSNVKKEKSKSSAEIVISHILRTYRMHCIDTVFTDGKWQAYKLTSKAVRELTEAISKAINKE